MHPKSICLIIALAVIAFIVLVPIANEYNLLKSITATSSVEVPASTVNAPTADALPSAKVSLESSNAICLATDDSPIFVQSFMTRLPPWQIFVLFSGPILGAFLLTVLTGHRTTKVLTALEKIGIFLAAIGFIEMLVLFLQTLLTNVYFAFILAIPCLVVPVILFFILPRSKGIRAYIASN